MALATACFYLLQAAPAAALTAEETFQDGNRLFQDELYWAALLRYRQAAEAGMDTPLLHYNTGVAHYRAKQYIRARTELMRAVTEPRLRVLAQYNLGLTTYALDDFDAALDWFRQARDQEENPELRRLAIIAISRIQAARRAENPIIVHEETERQARKLGEFSLRAAAGFGTDDNVYRTPADPYTDFSNPANPVAVVPEVRSGAFIPVDVDARFDVNSLRFESFFTAYRLQGRFYQDKELDSANDVSHELRFGSEFTRSEDNRSTRIYSAFTIARHVETYFDPDDGTPRTITVNNADQVIDDRLNYVRFGPEFSVRKSRDRLAYGLRIKGQVWDYSDPKVVPEYDHEYFLLGANVQYRFTETSLLRLTVDRSSRRYGDRPSFGSNGLQLVTNPMLRYDYLDIGLLARQRITSSLWFGFGYQFSSRKDTYVGYNDYTRDGYGFEFHWSQGPRFDLDLQTWYRIYDYPNAFAFNNPALPVKTLETATGQLRLSYRFTPHLSMQSQIEYRGTASTDTRIGYDRNWYSIGVVWRQ